MKDKVAYKEPTVKRWEPEASNQGRLGQWTHPGVLRVSKQSLTAKEDILNTEK